MGIEISGGLQEGGWTLRFAADALAVLYRSNGFPNRIVVTFDELSAFNHSRPAVSGDGVVLQCQADHLHLATSQTAWYQTPEIFDVLPIMQEICSAYDEVLLFGHSMGGYAALLFSGPLKATNVVAFAPQFSVDPKRAPFENRFNNYVNGLKFVYDDMLESMSKTAPLNVVFDPHTQHDNEHVKFMLACSNLRPFRLPFSGHFPAEFLKEIGCLSRTIIDLLLSIDNQAEIRQRIRRGRRQSHRYFLESATRASQRRNPREAFRLASIAYVLSPDSPAVLETFHSMLMYDHVLYGVSHAMIRLIQHEQPTWTHYDNARASMFEELRKMAEPVISKGRQLSEIDASTFLDD